MGNLTLEGRIVVFKALTISKMVFLALLTKILYPEVKELEKIRKTFLWKNAAPKIKHETTCKDCKDVGLKNFDRSCKIVSLQCSWIKTLYNEYFHAWKLTPLHLVTMSFGSTLKFHSNIKKKKALLKKLLSFYRDICINWRTQFSSCSETPGCLLSQFLWFNKYIQIKDLRV